MARNEVTARLSLRDRQKFSRDADRAGKDIEGIGRSAGRQARHLGGFTKGIGRVARGLATMGAAVGVAGFALGSKFVRDARESAKVAAITASVIKSTGGAAGLTAKQVGGLATAISEKTGIDDEAIQSNANLLLTFTKVRDEVGKGNQIFSRATGLAQDMATVMGTDAKGASMQLGKALNDPVKGISALSRAGVSFTAQQKDQIKGLVKHGDMLGAQKIILREVGKEFGGAAAAAATPMDKLKVTVGNLSEKIGAGLLPYVDRFSTWMLTKGLPAAKRFAGRLRDMWQRFKDIGGDQSLKDLLGAVGGLFKALAPKVGKGTGAVSDFKSAVDVATGVIEFMADHATALKGVVIALGIAFGGPVTATLAIGAALVWAYKKSDRFRWFVLTLGISVVKTFGWMLLAVEKFLGALGHIPGFGWAKTAAEKVRGLRKKVQGLATDLEDLRDKKPPTIPIVIKPKIDTSTLAGKAYYEAVYGHKPSFIGPVVEGGPGSVKKKPKGFVGPVARAAGGLVRPGIDYIVGEHRPELLRFDRPGRIEPRVPSLSMPPLPAWSGGDAAGGDGAAAVPFVVHTTVILDGKVVAESTDTVVADKQARNR